MSPGKHQPRKRGKHVGAVVDHLREIRAANISVRFSKHVHVFWSRGGRSFRTIMSGSPKDRDICAKNTIRAIDHMMEMV